MKKLLLTTVAMSVAFYCYAQSQIITTGNNVVDPTNPLAADIVIGSNANGGARHDGSVMWWSNISASRISNTADIFYLSRWNTTTPNVALAAYLGGSSYFQGNLGIGTTNPVTPLDITGNLTLENTQNVPNAGATIHFTSFYTSNPGPIIKSSLQLAGAHTDNNLILSSYWDGYKNELTLTNGNVGIGTATPFGTLDINFNNGEPKNMFIFSSSVNTTFSPVGGIRFAWYDNNFADIQMVRQGGAADGLGLSFHTSTSNNGTTTERMRINATGNVGIGTTNPQYPLDVYGIMHAHQVNVDLTGTPDYVFDKDYHLPTLAETEAYISQNHHLAEIPSAAEITKNGLDLGEMNKLLLKKVEELTLYLIEKDKEIKEEKYLACEQKRALKDQSTQLKSQQEQIDQLKNQMQLILKTK
jgi:hypothetical protein